jgi:hypothetical protein
LQRPFRFGPRGGNDFRELVIGHVWQGTARRYWQGLVLVGADFDHSVDDCAALHIQDFFDFTIQIPTFLAGGRSAVTVGLADC